MSTERLTPSPALAQAVAAMPALQPQVAGSFRLAQDADGIFGAPSFVYRGELFWGHDRMEHLKRAVVG